MTSVASITNAEFKDALNRYPELIKQFSDAEKAAPVTLEQLDKFRYIDAPAAFSKQTGRVLEADDVQKLTAWKLRHGKWRPSLSKLVASNSDETISKATSEAFEHHASNPTDITGTIKLLSAPLKGIGPATASLLLSVHDPDNIIFFSDEAYRWLVADGKKISLKYDVKEYEAVHKAAQALSSRLQTVTPIEIEKVAFVIIKESEPVKEKSMPYIPTGKPRGRPAKPDSEKKPKKAPSGAGRGRPAKNGGATLAKKQGLPVAAKDGSEETSDTPASGKKRGRLSKTETDEVAALVSGKKRGRPAGVKNGDEPNAKKAKA